MTGTYGVLAALGHAAQTAAAGAPQIILTGMDFYAGTQRYTFETGKNQSALLGLDMNQRRVDTSQHNTDLDLAIFEQIQEHTDGTLRRTTSGSKLDDLMEMAPPRHGPALDIRPTNPPTDWAPRAGLYPITALKFMRWLRGSMKRPYKRRYFR